MHQHRREDDLAEHHEALGRMDDDAAREHRKEGKQIEVIAEGQGRLEGVVQREACLDHRPHRLIGAPVEIVPQRRVDQAHPQLHVEMRDQDYAIGESGEAIVDQPLGLLRTDQKQAEHADQRQRHAVAHAGEFQRVSRRDREGQVERPGKGQGDGEKAESEHKFGRSGHRQQVHARPRGRRHQLVREQPCADIHDRLVVPIASRRADSPLPGTRTQACCFSAP